MAPPPRCTPDGESLDHDHVLADLDERNATVLEAVEATDGWATSVRASRPPMTIMGALGGIAAGLRQMRRTRPLETLVVGVGDGLDPRWHDWSSVVEASSELALRVGGAVS